MKPRLRRAKQFIHGRGNRLSGHSSCVKQLLKVFTRTQPVGGDPISIAPSCGWEDVDAVLSFAAECGRTIAEMSRIRSKGELMRRSLACIVALLLSMGFAISALAQDATPAGGATPIANGTPAAGSAMTPVASGLTTPRGFIWDSDGSIIVALGGSGGSTAATEDSPAGQILGPFMGGTTGAVARIENGCATAIATGLPSTLDAMGEVLGAEDVAMLGGQLYVSSDGGGAAHGNPDHPSGVYKVNGDGTAT